MSIITLPRTDAADPSIEQQARVDLAAALRLAVRHGFHEGICNHFSVMLPGASDRFLINPWGLHWSEVTASDLVLCDAHGTVLAGRHGLEPTALFIHAAIHRRHPAATAVLHTHMPYATALTLIDGGRLEPVSQTALRFHNRIAYDDHYNGLALDHQEGDRIAAAMGDRPVAMLASHGVVVTGASVAEAWDELYYLERAAQLQVLAVSQGRPLRQLAPEVVEATARQMAGECPPQAHRHFAALKRLLDRDEPDYAC
ncbi:MAG: aldolase [Alphaproteobacteria bacterium]|nr:aldolase [Alphaproteobacteria bacterium]